MINVYGLRSKHDASDAYRDFLREEGAPTLLRRYSSKEQNGQQFTDLNRLFVVGNELTEPHHPQQNPAELRAVKWLKDHSQVLMDCTGAPPQTWLEACEYLTDIHNICADETLNWQVPVTVRHGNTPDISAYLQFRFYEKIFYLDPKETFPDSKEQPGYWLGVAQNVGDELTFKILTNDTHQIIHRSVARPVDGACPLTRCI